MTFRRNVVGELFNCFLCLLIFFFVFLFSLFLFLYDFICVYFRFEIIITYINSIKSTKKTIKTLMNVSVMKIFVVEMNVVLIRMDPIDVKYFLDVLVVLHQMMMAHNALVSCHSYLFRKNMLLSSLLIPPLHRRSLIIHFFLSLSLFSRH